MHDGQLHTQQQLHEVAREPAHPQPAQQAHAQKILHGQLQQQRLAAETPPSPFAPLDLFSVPRPPNGAVASSQVSPQVPLASKAAVASAPASNAPRRLGMRNPILDAARGNEPARQAWLKLAQSPQHRLTAQHVDVHPALEAAQAPPAAPAAAAAPPSARSVLSRLAQKQQGGAAARSASPLFDVASAVGVTGAAAAQASPEARTAAGAASIATPIALHGMQVPRQPPAPPLRPERLSPLAAAAKARAQESTLDWAAAAEQRNVDGIMKLINQGTEHAKQPSPQRAGHMGSFVPNRAADSGSVWPDAPPRGPGDAPLPQSAWTQRGPPAPLRHGGPAREQTWSVRDPPAAAAAHQQRHGVLQRPPQAHMAQSDLRNRFAQSQQPWQQQRPPFQQQHQQQQPQRGQPMQREPGRLPAPGAATRPDDGPLSAVDFMKQMAGLRGPTSASVGCAGCETGMSAYHTSAQWPAQWSCQACLFTRAFDVHPGVDVMARSESMAGLIRTCVLLCMWPCA